MSPALNAAPPMHVLGRADNRERAHGQAELGHGREPFDHGSAAGHVALHVLHPQRRLERKAARVERHRLADETEHEVVARARRVVAEDDQLRLVRARRADRGECTHALFLDPRAPVRLDREVGLREPLRIVGERGREEVVGRPVDEVARRVEMARDDRLPLDQLAQLVACGDRDRQLRSRRRGRACRGRRRTRRRPRPRRSLAPAPPA